MKSMHTKTKVLMQEYTKQLKGMGEYENKRWFSERMSLRLDELIGEMKGWMPNFVKSGKPEPEPENYLMPEDVPDKKPKSKRGK